MYAQRSRGGLLNGKRPQIACLVQINTVQHCLKRAQTITNIQHVKQWVDLPASENDHRLGVPSPLVKRRRRPSADFGIITISGTRHFVTRRVFLLTTAPRMVHLSNTGRQRGRPRGIRGENRRDAQLRREEAPEAAAQDVRCGETIREAAARHGANATTLRHRHHVLRALMTIQRTRIAGGSKDADPATPRGIAPAEAHASGG
ncbi:hypothetical protein B0H11DRAFT_1901431 [Mycena galericulata]|nr:hypothetical protein B0H11DRAFT_1901431 [Mycena galericulata]